MKRPNPIKILWILLLLLPFGVQAQNQPAPGTSDYRKMQEAAKNPVVQSAIQKNYPTLQKQATESPDKTDQTSRFAQSNVGQSFSCSVENPLLDPSFSYLPANDDSSTSVINIPFNFNFFGTNYNQVYINNNGNITFDELDSTYSSTGFPSPRDMIAPFWADVDTRNNTGYVAYKVEATRLTVIWYNVGYFRMKSDKRNTFKLVISDGADPYIGAGNNVAFYYGDMQWTTGDASSSDNGFYGIPATVGLNNGQGSGSCYYSQLGRFGKPGSEYISSTDISGVSYLDYKCFTFDASTLEDVEADFDWQNLICAVDFTKYISNPQNCNVIHQWDFGDGTTSQEEAPLHSYASAGTYTVKLNVYYQCAACQGNFTTVTKQITVDPDEDLFKDTVIQVPTQVKSRVISTTTATFSDTWPLQYEASGLNDKSGYENGSEGVWRKETDYVYKVDRDQTNPPSLRDGGTFEMDQFSWEYAAIDAVPDWIKLNTMTAYSPYSYDIENENVLGIHNAALYDYGGHLPSANGVNMRYNEMAYTGFEYLTGKASGNWVFGNQQLPRYKWYPTDFCYKHIVIVKASLDEIQGYDEVDVFGRSYFWSGFPFFFYFRHIRDNEIICRREHPVHPEWSILILKRALFEGAWRGHVMFRNDIQPVVNANLDSNIAHSGSKSLKISGEETFEQKLLVLDSAKKYQVSAWVSVNDKHKTVPILAQNIGIEVKIKDKDDLQVASFMLKPKGNIIEGWQRIDSAFVCPIPNSSIELTFKSGSAPTAWFDDLRLFPSEGNMTSYVYNLTDYRLQATLDEENYASYFYYDSEGNLYLTKKETEEGVKTITENVSYLVEH